MRLIKTDKLSSFGRLSLVYTLIFCVPTVAMGQLTFEWGTARRDTVYKTVEDCLGLLTKVEGRTLVVDTTDYEALPSRLKIAQNIIDPVFVQTARQCSQPFTVAQFLAKDSLEMPRTLNAIELFLKAQRDADALALTDGWLAKLPASQDTLKSQIRARVALLAFERYPTQFTVVRKLADDIEFPRFWVKKVKLYGMMMERARELRDTTEFERTVAWLTTVPKLLGDSLMKAQEWGYNDEFPAAPPLGVMNLAMQYSNRATLLAKLRENVDSFLVFTALMNKDMGIGDGSVKRESAKPIIAKYWFPEKPSTPIPTPGKISIIWGMKAGGSLCNPCYYRNGFWGRIAKKFPEIEWTALLGTKGHHGKYASGTLSPDQEAQLMDSLHRTVEGFPGRIAIHQTEFWRVDETYDRRVIQEPGPNEGEHCLISGACDLPRIVDWDGKFIEFPRLSMDEDESLELFLTALLKSKRK